MLLAPELFKLKSPTGALWRILAVLTCAELCGLGYPQSLKLSHPPGTWIQVRTLPNFR